VSSPLYIEKSGAGDPLVLIHGMGSASNAFKPIRSTLDKNFSVVTIDLPGHGKSLIKK
jgi:Predicted hydrolases or acyltransferases (alpha/beta hydrolase superfamily)